VSYNTRCPDASDRINVPIVSELSSYTPQKETLITIGVFDGVHLGHEHLIGELTQLASSRNLLSGIITFNRHPRVVLAHQARLARLTTLDEKYILLKKLGVDFVIPLTFNEKVASLSAREFISLLQEHLRMSGLVIGPNFALGRKREGDTETLKLLGGETGFTVRVVEPLIIKDLMPSSTAIRQALVEGNMAMVNKLLGRHFSLNGVVVSGVERGQTMGFRTANLKVDGDHALPADGVYVTRARIGDNVYQSVTNIGLRPTFDENERSIETHILDFSADIYGQEIALEIVERLREEMKFSRPEELISQIGIDVRKAREILSEINGVRCER